MKRVDLMHADREEIESIDEDPVHGRTRLLIETLILPAHGRI